MCLRTPVPLLFVPLASGSTSCPATCDAHHVLTYCCCCCCCCVRNVSDDIHAALCIVPLASG
jgi:hypothetical protein